MENRLYIITCENYKKEIAKVLEYEGLEDVSLCTILASCGRPVQEVMDDIREIIMRHNEDRVKFRIIGGNCCAKFEELFKDMDRVSVQKNIECFNMLLNTSIVDSYLNEGSYLVTPGWLSHWKEYMDEWRFGRGIAMPFFKDTVSCIVLLDTDIDPDSDFYLKEFVDFTGLPFKSVKVGLDHLKMMISSMVCEWRLNNERREYKEASALVSRQSVEKEAVYKLALSLAGAITEEDIVSKAFDLLEESFKAKRICYIPLQNRSHGRIQYRGILLEECLFLKDEFIKDFFYEEYIYTKSGRWTVVYIRYRDDTLGVLAAEDIMLQDYLDMSAETARALSRILGSAIMINRKYWNMADSEKVLKERESRLRKIADSVMDVIGQVNKEGVLEYISQSCKRMFGYGPEEMIGRSFFDFLAQEHVFTVKGLINKSISLMEPLSYEFQFINSRGQNIWIEVLGRPVADRNSGTDCMIFSCRDVSIHKINEEKLRASEERYRQLIEVLPEAIFIHYEGKVMFCNKAAACLIGMRDPLELYGKSILNFLHKDCHQPAAERYKNIIMDKAAISLGEEKLVCIDGKILDVEIVSINFLYKGRSMVLDVMRDISERKHIEELRRKVDERNKQIEKVQEYDKLKTEFFANISHEFRTPINILLGSLQLLDFYHKYDMLENNKAELEGHIKVMRQNSYRLLRMANNIIDISRIESGFYEIHLKSGSIVSLVEDITLSAAEYIESKGRVLVFDTDVEEKVMVFDPEIIERIMLNLLSNAVKFTNPGDSIIVNMFDRGDSIVIAVRDTGIGIHSDKMDMIFQKFRQVDKSLTRAHEGSGIGLSIVKSLVEIHGGNVSVKSEYGKGSEFIVELKVNTFSNEGIICQQSNVVEKSHVERIALEFSDIYS